MPVEGALAASNPLPGPGEQIYLYLSATPQAATARLRLAITLPDGVSAVDGAPLSASFTDVAVGQTVTLTVPVRVATGEPRRLVATATVVDSAALTLQRAFVLELNPRAPPAPNAREGKDAQGHPLSVYESGK